MRNIHKNIAEKFEPQQWCVTEKKFALQNHLKKRAKAKRLHPDRNLMRLNILIVKIRALETLPTEKVTKCHF